MPKKRGKKGGKGRGGGGKNKIMKSKHGMIARPGKIQPFHAPKWCPPRRGDKAGVQGNQHLNLFGMTLFLWDSQRNFSKLLPQRLAEATGSKGLVGECGAAQWRGSYWGLGISAP